MNDVNLNRSLFGSQLESNMFYQVEVILDDKLNDM